MAASQTPTIFSQGEEPRQSQEEFKQLLSSLPRKDGQRPILYYQFQGFWFFERFLEGIFAAQRDFKAKDADVILVSTPKAGTTWLKALTFAVVHRSRFSDLQHHPLLTNNPHELVPYLEGQPYGNSPIPNLHSILSPAITASHIPYPMLPKSINDSNCKIVYISRDPKDVVVSYWHHITRVAEKIGTSIPLEDVFELFCAGVSASGPFWDHVREYWEASLEYPHKVWFLKYENLKRNPILELKGLAEFLGYGFTPKEIEEGLVEDILNLCSFKNLSNLEANKKGTLLAFGSKCLKFEIDKSLFFRRGEVGDWTNYLTTQMAERLDRITNERFQGLGLTF